MFNNKNVLFDSRWINSTHGIGRFAKELSARISGMLFVDNLLAPFSILDPIYLTYQIFIKKADIFFTPGINIPLMYWSRSIITVHDLTPLQFPRSLGIFKRFYFKYLLKLALRRCKAIITVSDFSKKAILEWLGNDRYSNKIFVVHNGVSYFTDTDKGSLANMGCKYFFYPTNDKPHKNIPNIIKAFASIDPEREIHFYLTCHDSIELFQLCSELKVKNRVHFLGKITEEQLFCYYKSALAVVFASLSEGFGLPIVEAMACGVPVITSNISVMPEIAGGAALLIDPHSTSSIAKAMMQITDSDCLRHELIAKGIKRAQCFSWDKAAKKIKEILFMITKG